MTNTIMLALLFTSHLAPEVGRVETVYRRFLVRQVRFTWGMDQKVSVFAAQLRQESGWDPKARSPFAAGLAQFTPDTAQWISAKFSGLARPSSGKPADMRLDWKWSIKAMVRYDAWLHRRIKKQPVGPAMLWPLTLRAYNGGLGWIYRELASCGKPGFLCCLRFRSRANCVENTRYPRVILHKWKPLYAGWDR